MDLNQAISKHVDWKLTFRTAIANEQTVDRHTIARDDGCELGVWLHGEARALFAHLPSYAECLSQHAAFHIEAALVADAINSGDFAHAEAMLAGDTPYVRTSSAVCIAILRLKKDAAL